MTNAGELKALVAKAKAYVSEQKRLAPQARVVTQKPLKAVAKPAKAELVAQAAAVRSALPSTSNPKPEAPWAASLEEFDAQISGCLRCTLGPTRKKFVFGSGNPKAKLVFFGLAPGAEEEAAGQPFAGEPGKLLTKMIAAMGFKREDVYLMNALKCRVPKGREAEAAELEACRPFYEQQLALIAPKAVCVMGPEATQALLGPEADFEKLRGKLQQHKDWSVMPSYHPAQLLRNESLKRQSWDDMKALLKIVS